MKQPTKKQFEEGIKSTLFANPKKKAEHENKEPTKEQLNQKWVLEKHK